MSQGGQVPKGKLSKGRRDRRRGGNWKLAALRLHRCPHCGNPGLSHAICRNCGWYKGREVLKTE
jgi:large subunit ribosomal protein L32